METCGDAAARAAACHAAAAHSIAYHRPSACCRQVGDDQLGAEKARKPRPEGRIIKYPPNFERGAYAIRASLGSPTCLLQRWERPTTRPTPPFDLWPPRSPWRKPWRKTHAPWHDQAGCPSPPRSLECADRKFLQA